MCTMCTRVERDDEVTRDFGVVKACAGGGDKMTRGFEVGRSCGVTRSFDVVGGSRRAGGVVMKVGDG